MVELTNAAKESKADGKKNVKRGMFLKALWGIYNALPHYVHPNDAALCKFPDSFKYEQFLCELGGAIAEYLCDGKEPITFTDRHEQDHTAEYLTEEGLELNKHTYNHAVVLFMIIIYVFLYRYCLRVQCSV